MLMKKILINWIYE